MKREKIIKQKIDKKTGFSEEEFIDYLEERFRMLRLDEQKFRDEVLAKNSWLEKASQYSKATR